MSRVDAPITVRTDDADLYLEQVGPQDARVVMYLHGGPGYSSFSFRDLMGDDLEAYRMVYTDARGGGRSYAGGPFGLDDLADDVATTLRATRLERATILAHGFGALVAARAATRHAERVERLVLVNPWFSMPLLSRTLLRRAARLAGRPEEAPPPEDALSDADALDPQETSERAYDLLPPKQLFDALEFPDPSTRLRLEHADAVAQFGPQRNDAPEDVWRLSVLDELAALRVPVVVLLGTRDGTAYPEQAEAGLARMPNAVTGLVEAGHYPWLDDPEAFVPLLLEALGPADAGPDGGAVEDDGSGQGSPGSTPGG